MSPLPYYRLAHDPQQRYTLFCPRGPIRGLWVSVHGISRNCREHLRRFRPWAERLGLVLVAPLFDRQRCQDYQRLGRAGKGLRADHLLQAIVGEVAERCQLADHRFHLFGYSGGGQFAHRFTMAHPEQVLSLAVGAAGWYTFPDLRLGYPRGLRPCRRLPDLDFEPRRFLRIPTLVTVGGRDDHPDPELNLKARIVSQQGGSRLERGRNWIAAMEEAARHQGFNTPYRFEVIAGAGHDFGQCMDLGMGAVVADFIANQLPPPLPIPCHSRIADTLCR
ncbi:MAG: hypothetical protein AXA67_06700 [Methylothermaceae bacteria B42]|nr:MAG: hypothetical protein AXA67_06700 [Methylothermaceae bacteria B42]HHJ39771.1 hypothetical protein [Methylothermaceae bacterium]